MLCSNDFEQSNDIFSESNIAFGKCDILCLRLNMIYSASQNVIYSPDGECDIYLYSVFLAEEKVRCIRLLTGSIMGPVGGKYISLCIMHYEL